MGDTRPPHEQGTQATQTVAGIAAQWDALPRGASLGRYVILDTLGSGGMGVVYAAYDPDLDRKIAIKLLRPDRVETDADSSGQTRLMREARSLAKLSHRNVLPVFDVGRFGDQIFLAMEYVDGKTLREWQKAASPPWRETLRYYLYAGRGLAAAHGANVVHRDFKAQNVMVGNDGQVRVMDFGLARTAGDDEVITTDTPEPRSPEPLAGPLTRTGSLLGTPGYMAPEQLDGKAVDARSDQFSFAVALYEALYGERPFAGDTPATLSANVKQGAVLPPPTDSGVPAWLRRVLLKALSADPGARYANMDALLATLGRDPTRIRNRWLGGIAATLVAIGIGITLFNDQQQAGPVCKDAGRKLAGIWDGPRARTIEKAFLATGLPYAADSWKTVRRLLDEYGSKWTATHTQACEATRVHGEQSEQLLDLRMACLEGRRQEVRALTDLFTTADAATMSKAARAAGLISPIEACSDTATLLARVPLPAEPGKRQAVSEVENDLARAKALRETGRYKQSEQAARTALARAEATGYEPALAHANYRVGDALDYLGDSKSAEGFFQNAFAQAIAGGDDRRAAVAATAQVWVVGHILNRPEDGSAWAEYGHAFLERLGGDARIEADLLSTEGTVAQDKGDYDVALARAERVLELRREAFGETHERVAAAMINLANAKRYTGHEGAVKLYRKAYEIFSDTVGEDYPSNTVTLYNLGGALSELGRYEEAHPILVKAVDLGRRTLGPDHFQTAVAMQNLAEVELALGRYEESLARYLAARPVLEKNLGTDHPFIAPVLAGIAANLIAMGRFEDSLPHIERGLSLTEGTAGQEQPLSMLRLAQARIAHRRDQDLGKAKSLALQALELAQAAGPVAATQKKTAEEFLAELETGDRILNPAK